MKLDLDELERKARAEIAAQAAAPVNVITPELGRAAWAHLDAMRPPVTLALIARIRELESEVELRERAIIAVGDTIAQVQKQNGELVTALVSLRMLVEAWALARDRFEGWPVQDAKDEFRSASDRLAESCDGAKP